MRSPSACSHSAARVWATYHAASAETHFAARTRCIPACCTLHASTGSRSSHRCGGTDSAMSLEESRPLTLNERLGSTYRASQCAGPGGSGARETHLVCGVRGVGTCCRSCGIRGFKGGVHGSAAASVRRALRVAPVRLFECVVRSCVCMYLLTLVNATPFSMNYCAALGRTHCSASYTS